MAGLCEERDAAVGVRDSLVGAEQSPRGGEWVLVESSGVEPCSVREAEWFTCWRGGSASAGLPSWSAGQVVRFKYLAGDGSWFCGPDTATIVHDEYQTVDSLIVV